MTHLHISPLSRTRYSVATCSWHGHTRISSFSTGFCGQRIERLPFRPQHPQLWRKRQTPRAGFSGGGFLGVGPAEVVIIVAVGWLLLGPEKLFALAKDSGKLLGDLRRTANEARETFSEAMELDVLAAELAENKKTKGKDETETELEAESEVDPALAVALQTPVEENAVSVEEQIASVAEKPVSVEEKTVSVEEKQVQVADAPVSASFLEQLQRVLDPGQKAEQDIPDIDIDDEEEREVRRLEKQYLEAREKLAKRRMGIEKTENPSITEDEKES